MGRSGADYILKPSVSPLTPAVGDYVGVRHVSRGTTNGAADRLEVCPIRIKQDMTFDRIACEVTTGGANGTARLGIYSHDTTTNRPGSLVLDAGTVDASTNGLKAITINKQLSAGIYWLAFAAQGAGATAPVYRRTVTSLEEVPTTDLSGSDHDQAYTQGSVSGALPDPMVVGGANQGAMLVWIRRSA